MKKLLLMAGILVSFTAMASIKNNFDKSNEFFGERKLDNFNKLFDLETSLLRNAIPVEGCIPCDIINQFSKEELALIKEQALSTPSYTADDLIRSVVLYNNIVRCEKKTAMILSPAYCVERWEEGEWYWMKNSPE